MPYLFIILCDTGDAFDVMSPAINAIICTAAKRTSSPKLIHQLKMRKLPSRFSISPGPRAGLAVLLLSLHPVAFADTGYYSGSYSGFDGPIDFSLSLSNSDIDLHSENHTNPIALDRVSVSIFSFEDPQIQFGFITGSSALSIDNDPVSAGISFNGYHAGLALRSVYGSNPQLGFHANYLYQEAKGETTNQAVTLSWHEWATGITGKVILGQQLGLIAGVAYNALSARRHATGNVNETRDMTLNSNTQGLLELEWRMLTGGHVAIALQRGDYRQVEFKFAQTFK